MPLCSQIFEEFLKFGEIEEIAVCENLGDHMIGNVYVKYAPIYFFFTLCIRAIGLGTMFGFLLLFAFS